MINITEKEFRHLAEFIKRSYGIHLNHDKKALVEGRLHRILDEKNFENFSQFLDYVKSDATGEAITSLVNRITTNHTYFMRETQHFDYFKNRVLPYLASTQSTYKDLRIWSAGCSSGEEPYTLAMIIADFFSSGKILWDTKILATDISTKALEVGVNGIYSNEQISSLPPNWKTGYFKKLDVEKSVITDKIKNEVIFRRFNLMNESFPFKKRFHVIFCRNVMIYFDSKTKRDLINRFYEFTEPGGYLFIGHSESLNRDETRYKYIMPAVYRKE